MRCTVMQVLHLQVVRALPPETDLALLSLAAVRGAGDNRGAAGGRHVPGARGAERGGAEACRAMRRRCRRGALPRRPPSARLGQLTLCQTMSAGTRRQKRQSGSSILQMHCSA